MTVEFYCMKCNQLLSVDSSTTGKQARCPKCSTVQTIPDAGPTTSPIPAQAPGGIFCSKCGAKNAENAYSCVQCGKVLHQFTATGPRETIPNYLVQAILVTIFCCLPFGIVSIVYAAQVNGKLAGGDIEGARGDSEKAKLWAWISFGLGLGWVVFYFLFILLAAAHG